MRANKILWRMVRNCNSHELRSQAPFTARAVCAGSEPGNFVAVSNPVPYTIKTKSAQGRFNFYGGWGGIRTPGRVAPSAVFKTVAFDRSATHPETVNASIIYYFFHNANVKFAICSCFLTKKIERD